MTQAIEIVQDRTKIEQIKTMIDIKDSSSIISFGTSIQKNLTEITEQMLSGVKSKDTGPIGESLVSMVTQMRGLDFGLVDPNNKPGFFAKLLSKVTPLAKFVQQYETISSHIDVVERDLFNHKKTLYEDINLLDVLYDKTLDYFRELSQFIVAAEEVLAYQNETIIPELRTKADDVLGAQSLNDVINTTTTLERKLHDLKLTRSVVMQTLPSIRIVQDNNKGLIEKIQSQILNSIPMWKQQMAVAIAMWRTTEAAEASRKVSDYQNDLLVQTSEMLNQGNRLAKNEIERGIYDIEAVKKANDNLIKTINESIEITNTGRQNRVNAAKELLQCEETLKVALRSAS